MTNRQALGRMAATVFLACLLSLGVSPAWLRIMVALSLTLVLLAAVGAFRR